MEVENVQVAIHLNRFFEKCSSDPRIGTAHIAVYMAILNIWLKRGCTNSIYLFSWEVMPEAKISGRMTYRKAIRELCEYGYLFYRASMSKHRGSRFELCCNV
ncbi:MAG: hypothetical protein LBF27_13920 [Sphingobacterium sp.]|jgi:hypothetical protein|nr:hypothetical protein [Sphingobacterium sp.]